MEKVTTLANGISVGRDEPAPLVMQIVFPRGAGMIIGGGMPQIDERTEHFVCISKLPKDLQEKIWSSIDYMMRG